MSNFGLSGCLCIVSTDASDQSSKAKWPLWVIVFLCIVGAVVYFVSEGRRAATPEGAARILVVDVELDDVPDKVLPHTVDQSTEFKGSLKHLKEDVTEPEYRETATALKVAEAKVAPALREHIVVDGVEKTTQAKAEIAVPVETIQATELESGSPMTMTVSRDWKGMVLVPDSVKMARAYSTAVRMSRIEAHPIDGGRIRVWSRIENLTSKPMHIETACEFRFTDKPASLTAFRSLWIPADGAIDVDFKSGSNRVSSYTLMVK